MPDFKVHTFADDRTLADTHALMAACFTDETATSPVFLRWLYLDNPAGRGTGVIAYEAGEPVSQACMIPQRMTFNGEQHTVGLILNVCTLASHRGRGLLVEGARRLIEEGRRRGFTLLCGFSNPASHGAYVKLGCLVPERFKFVVVPINYFGLARDTLNRSEFTTLARTDDLPVESSAFRRFRVLDEAPRTDASVAKDEPDTWRVPLTQAHLRWRYLTHPTRKYFLLGHPPTGELIAVRFLCLYNLKTCAVLKTSCATPRALGRVMRDLKADCRRIVNSITMLHSPAHGGALRSLARGRYVIPHRLSPRDVPLIVFPLADEARVRRSRFELSFGDYDVL